MPSVSGDVLPAAAAAGAQERLGVLVVVVVVRVVALGADGGRDDLARRQRRAVVDGDDADAVDHELSCSGLSGSGASIGPPITTGLKPSIVAELVLPADQRLAARAGLARRGDRRRLR